MDEEFVRIENDINDKNCYINVVIQIIYHLNDLKENLLDIEIYKESPQIITQLVLLLSSYSIAKTKKDCILQNKNFRNALSLYFKDTKEFQLKQEADPIELLQILLNFIHTYVITNYNKIGYSDKKCEPYCLIHKALYIDLTEKSYCCNKNCDFKNETKYDSNYFIHLINVSSILQVADSYFSSFIEFNEKLINCVNLGRKQCPKCNSSDINFQYICNYTGKYLLLQLIWENDRINFQILLKIFCMINSNFSLSSLFGESQNSIFSFIGLVLFYLNHYICLFYENNKKQFILYDDLNIEVYNTWDEVVEKLLFGHYQPILLIYENNNDSNNNCTFNLNKEIYKKFSELCDERDNGYMNKKPVKLINNDEWECKYCNTINKNNNDICKKCKKKNEIISLLIKQEQYNIKNRNSLSKSTINNESKNNVWKCKICNSINKNDIYTCIKCGKKREQILRFFSQDHKKIKNYQESPNNYNNSEENSKNSVENNTPKHLKKPFKNSSLYEQKISDNPFDIPREKTYIFNREKELSLEKIYSNNNNNNDKNEKNINNQFLFRSVKIQNEWKCPFCKSLNSQEKCATCGRRNNGFNKNIVNNGWECPKCNYINPSIENSICYNCHFLYKIIATINNKRDKIKKNNSVDPLVRNTIKKEMQKNEQKKNIMNKNMNYNINEIHNIKPMIIKDNENKNIFRSNINKKEDHLNKFLSKK